MLPTRQFPKSPPGAIRPGEKENNLMCHASSAWARRRHAFAFAHHHGGGFGESHGGPSGWGGYFMHPGGEGGGGAGFGVRRPLRFLAHKLELNEQQVTQLARILDELKIERAQGDVDDRRALADLADAIGSEAFDAGKATAAGERRVASAAKLRDAVARSLQQIHAILTPEQRAKLAYLIRTGVLVM
jgi:Spy/CpxP family protein refolding chaperone